MPDEDLTETLNLASLALVRSELFQQARVGERLSLHFEATKLNDTQGIDNTLVITARKAATP